MASLSSGQAGKVSSGGFFPLGDFPGGDIFDPVWEKLLFSQMGDWIKTCSPSQACLPRDLGPG